MSRGDPSYSRGTHLVGGGGTPESRPPLEELRIGRVGDGAGGVGPARGAAVRLVLRRNHFVFARGRGLAGAALVLSSFWSPFTSSTNWPMSLNCRYTDANRT